MADHNTLMSANPAKKKKWATKNAKTMKEKEKRFLKPIYFEK